MTLNLVSSRILVIAIAAIWDFTVGDPAKMIHPVQVIGALISGLERSLRKIFHLDGGARQDKAKNRAAGLLLTAAVVIISTAFSILITKLFYIIHPAAGMIAEGILCGQMLAYRSLRQAAEAVRIPLAAGDTDKARRAVSMIVGRDTAQLGAEGITRAAVETAAENTSDGIIAPLIFEMLFGAPGAYFYKSVNTLDSMIGYKNDKYRYFGTAAARLDDAVNYLPSRISAVLMILASGPAGGDMKNAWRIWRRDRRKHPSPNSAQTESVCAGALHISLAGPMYYFGELHNKPYIGDSDRDVRPEDIRMAEKLMGGCYILTLAAGMLIMITVYIFLV